MSVHRIALWAKVNPPPEGTGGMAILCPRLARLRKFYAASRGGNSFVRSHHGAGLRIVPTGSGSWAANRSAGWSWYHQ